MNFLKWFETDNFEDFENRMRKSGKFDAEAWRKLNIENKENRAIPIWANCPKGPQAPPTPRSPVQSSTLTQCNDGKFSFSFSSGPVAIGAQGKLKEFAIDRDAKGTKIRIMLEN